MRVTSSISTVVEVDDPTDADIFQQAMKQGRRPGRPGTREAILAAARRHFAERGYDGTTMRGVAAVAGVEGALGHYYFGSKRELFAAALELPVNPADAVVALLEEGTERLGERLLRLLLTVWDSPESGAPLRALLRSVDSQQELLRGFVEREIVGRLAEVIDGPDAALRASAAATQIVGLLFVRYVARVEPVASAGHDELVRLIAPSLQRYFEPD
jgi:AcrR family transcriptional regulator